MDELLKAINELREEIMKRFDLLEIRQYKENTLLLTDIDEKLSSIVTQNVSCCRESGTTSELQSQTKT